MVSLPRGPALWWALTRLVLGFVAITALAAWLLSVAMAERPVPIHVRWKADVADDERHTLERGFQLTGGEATEGTTWRYVLTDSSRANIGAIVQNPRVDDTHHVDRVRFRPGFTYDRPRRIVFFSLLTGAIGALLLVVVAVAVSGRTTPDPLERRP